MKEIHNKRVLVLTRNYSTGLSVIRSLGSAGYEVDVVASSYKKNGMRIALASKYIRQSCEVVSKKVENGNDEELLEVLFRYAEEQSTPVVLFPTDDYTTSIIDLNRDRLQEYFILPSIVGGGQGALTKHMDKTVQGELARKAGLLTPLEWILSLKEEITIPEDMVYPCFCKPIESISGYKKEMAVCNTKAELKAHLLELKRRASNRSVLVQEFLNITQEIDLSGVCLDQDIIIPAIIEKTKIAQHERGVTLAGTIVPLERIEEIKKNVIQLLKSFHYVGMFDMELNVVGDKIYFNEVNLRSGGPNYSYFASGVNLPAVFVKSVLGEKYTDEEIVIKEYGKTFVYEKVAWEDYVNGFITKKELKKHINDADIHLLYNKEDPMPERLFKLIIRASFLKRQLKKCRQSVRKAIYPILSKIKQALFQYPQRKAENARNLKDAPPRVIVAGRNYCSNLCMARSLGEAGYDVEVVRVFQRRPRLKAIMSFLKPDIYCKYVKAYYECILRRDGSRLVNFIKTLAEPDKKILLIPNDDLVTSTVDLYLDELSDFFLIPSINHQEGKINQLMSKSQQKALAFAAGLPVLNSCVIKTEKGKFEIPSSVSYPCFIKPNISKNSSKSRIRKCESEYELREALTEFSAKKDIEMLVEDYIEIEKEYSMLGVSTKDGAIGPGIFVVEAGGHAERKGVAMCGRILPYQDMQPLADQLIGFVDSLNYEGLFDIDLIETTDGKIYFVELNLRFGASGYSVTQSGVNLPGMYADYMYFGKSIEMDSVVEPGKIFISEKIMLDEYIGGFLTKDEMNQWMDKVDIHFVKNDSDPGPYRHFKKFYPIASVLRTYRAIKSKQANTTT